jgi:mycothiol synthase
MGDIELQPARPDDIARLVALHRRSEAHDGVPRVIEEEEMRVDLDDVRVVLDTDVRLAFVDGQLAGYVFAMHIPSDADFERCFVFGEVDPSWRGRGVGHALLTWGTERARQRLCSSGSAVRKYIRVDAYDYIESAHRLYPRLGFAPVRWFEELRRPLTDLPAPTEIDGVELRPWPADRDDECLQVKNSAFADHWGSTATPPDLWHHMVRGFGARPDLSFVAIERATDRIVATCLNHRYPADDEVTGRRDGWIESLGTLSEWRGRGLASALLIASLHSFAAADLTHASLGVDAESPTGAARLYRSLGFELQQRSITYQIEVA